MIYVNLIGTFHLIKAALPGMKKNRADKGPGSIAIMSSQAGQVGIYGYTAYSASKFGLKGLAEALQQKVIADNIHVSLIFPPDTKSPGFAEDGVNPSDIWGEVPSCSTCNIIVMEQKTLLEKMDEQIRKQGQHIAMLESKIFNQPNQNLGSNCNNIQHTSSSSSSLLSDPASLSLRIECFVSIKSLFDSTKIVAKGVVRSMDPNIEVGRQMLGPNWILFKMRWLKMHYKFAAVFIYGT